MRIIVVGSGGREHALAWKLREHSVSVVPGNGGTPPTRDLRLDDVDSTAKYCSDVGAELVVVGPEAALEAGLVDALRARKIAAFGPTRSAARLETSKVWAREFMKVHRVAVPEHWPFHGVEEARGLVRRLAGDCVVKFDGLAAGKGVWVCQSAADAEHALAELSERHGGAASGVVEQRLIGPEVSVIGLIDGRDARLLALSRDHKRLLDGDRGPNTGGMGAFTPVGDVDGAQLDRIRREIVDPTLEGLSAEGLEYSGFLYFGVLLSAAGPKLLEYNVRLGDPEAEVVLPALDSDLAELILLCLDRQVGTAELRVSADAVIDVVLASEGYPAKPITGRLISGLDTLDPDTLAFHAGTAREAGRLVTSGGRVLNLVVRAPSLFEARSRVYREVSKVCFEGKQYRTDIGLRVRAES